MLSEEPSAAHYAAHKIELLGKTYPYRLLSPPEGAESESHPLVIFLHGVGQRGNDNVQHLKFLPTWMALPDWREKFPCYLLAPQCPEDDFWTVQDWENRQLKPLPEHPNAALQAVGTQIDEVLEKHPDIDRSRIYLTGLSMGGCGAWELGMRRADLFAALAPICGGGDTSQVARLKGLPIWTYHGDIDDVIIPDWSRQLVQALKDAKHQPEIHYTELPGIEHDAWTPAYSGPDLLPWMFSKRKG